MALDFRVVNERIPTTPAASTTMIDHRFGRETKSVRKEAPRDLGTRSGARQTAVSTQAETAATARPATSASSDPACEAESARRERDAGTGHRAEIRSDDHRADDEDDRVRE